MTPSSDANKIIREMKAAQRKAEQQMQRELKRAADQANREIDQHNRKVEKKNRQAVAEYNRKVDAHNRAADRHNRQEVSRVNRELRKAASQPTVSYTESERQLAQRVQETVTTQETREYHVFLSYARIDGSEIASSLRDNLEGMGVSVWFDEVAIRPGKSLALQMDQGLRRAHAGVAVLTAAYLTGRFWTERELGVLLHKSTLIPVLHNVTFEDVAQYSGILPDLAGFSTEHDSVREIAEKIAAAVLVTESS
ncbi:toll/interleukin-1 receptor domain-containing protein [Streptomyces sp. NPDC058653]|uniref:toll/interleukin-1 receptor domain-containing protein n=1 Tax=Streptomyces sp. NPDC058653 TaxID=3346576 RepID=UPI003649EC1A